MQIVAMTNLLCKRRHIGVYQAEVTFSSYLHVDRYLRKEEWLFWMKTCISFSLCVAQILMKEGLLNSKWDKAARRYQALRSLVLVVLSHRLVNMYQHFRGTTLLQTWVTVYQSTWCNIQFVSLIVIEGRWLRYSFWKCDTFHIASDSKCG
jgi:hypothetical protein